MPTAEKITANMNPIKELVAKAGATPNLNIAINKIKNGTTINNNALDIGTMLFIISKGIANEVMFDVKLYNTCTTSYHPENCKYQRNHHDCRYGIKYIIIKLQYHK